jgi:myosin heavy subunit
VQEHNHEYERELKKLRKEIAELNEQNKILEKNSKNYTIVSGLEADVERLTAQVKKLTQENIALQNVVRSVGEEKDAYEKLQADYNKLVEVHKVQTAEYDANKKYIYELEAKKAALEKENADLKVVAVPVSASASASAPAPKPVAVESKTVTHPLLGKIQEPIVAPAQVPVQEGTDEEAETEEGVDPSSLPNFKHKGVIYKRDADNTLYSETEEGWEIVGTWDEASKSIIVETASVEEEVEEAEEEPELTEFIFKGKTYYLDEENAVFQSTDEGYEQVGTWNGKKILFE